MTVCDRCGQENPEGFSFCGGCGAPLEQAEARREVRKTVTVVFCDLTGSTALGEQRDPEAVRATMQRYFDESRAILERHGVSTYREKSAHVAEGRARARALFAEL